MQNIAICRGKRQIPRFRHSAPTATNFCPCPIPIRTSPLNFTSPYTRIVPCKGRSGCWQAPDPSRQINIKILNHLSRIGADRIKNFKSDRIRMQDSKFKIQDSIQDEMIRLAEPDRTGSGSQRKNNLIFASLEKVSRHHYCTGHTFDLLLSTNNRPASKKCDKCIISRYLRLELSVANTIIQYET
jgi:hypothetical protein